MIIDVRICRRYRVLVDIEARKKRTTARFLYPSQKDREEERPKIPILPK
jgi:hypothetical protein